MVTVLTAPGDDEIPAALQGENPIVAVGIASIEIVRAAEQTGADLLVIGRCPCAREAPRVGSTADSVARRSPIPCLFVGPEGQLNGRTVVALDGTERGLSVLTGAMAFQALAGGDLEVVTVEPLVKGAGHEAPRSARTLRVMEALAERSGPGDRTTPLHTLKGDPARKIPEFMSGIDGALLVVGARRWGPGGVPGSTGVGRALLHAAAWPVLTIPI